MAKECPQCGREMDHIVAEPDVGIVGCFVCYECEYTVNDWDYCDESDEGSANC